MNLNKEMNGIWIFPNGNTYISQNISSHIITLVDELNLKEILLNAGKGMTWSEEQKKLHLDSDIIYIAMKLGYIRVTHYLNQFVLQTVSYPISKQQINSIFEYYQSISDKFKIDTFTLDLYDDMSTFFTFNTIYELLEKAEHFIH